MEGNDLGSHWSMKFIVLAEPTLFYLPKEERHRFYIAGRGFGKVERIASDFIINRAMMQFCVNMGRERNIPTEVWAIGANPEIYNRLASKVEQMAPSCIVSWENFDEEADAVFALRVDNSIHTVYDADPDRLERLWGMRGQRVLRGAAPSS